MLSVYEISAKSINHLKLKYHELQPLDQLGYLRLVYTYVQTLMTAKGV